MSNEVKTQVVVLGGGPGGYSAAFRAADLGLDVVVVERYNTLGGVCLNVGCIPSKALLHVAKSIEDAATMGASGVEFGKPKIDLDKIRAHKEKVISQLTGGLDRKSTRLNSSRVRISYAVFCLKKKKAQPRRRLRRRSVRPARSSPATPQPSPRAPPTATRSAARP